MCWGALGFRRGGGETGTTASPNLKVPEHPQCARGVGQQLILRQKKKVANSPKTS